MLSVSLPIWAADEPTVRLYEHVAPKALGTVPDGWRLEKLSGHTIQQPPIALPNGESTNISTTAYTLTPQPAPGVVVLRDPGYVASDGLAQKATLGAVLTAQIENSAALEQKLAGAITQLRQQLSVTPAPVPAPQAEAKPDTEPPKADAKPAPKPRAKPTPTPTPAATPIPVATPTPKSWGIFKKK